jgi:hypothetical protein
MDTVGAARTGNGTVVPAAASAEQLLAVHHVVLPPRDPRDLSLHVMHNLSSEAAGADGVRVRMPDMHDMARSSIGPWFVRLCR